MELKEDRQQRKVRMQGSKQGRVGNWMVGLGFYAILFYGDLSFENIFFKCCSSLKYKSTLKKERIYRFHGLKLYKNYFQKCFVHFKCIMMNNIFYILCLSLALHEPNIQKVNYKKYSFMSMNVKTSIKEM